MPTGIRRWLIAWNGILPNARDHGRERGDSRSGTPTVDDGELSRELWKGCWLRVLLTKGAILVSGRFGARRRGGSKLTK